jgi:SDR family mycofactocin-dependent oxidoreductase
LRVDLEGRVALVTGAGRGQGRSHALALAEAGADIVVCDRAQDLSTIPYQLASKADLEETARAVRARGRRCLSLVADVRNVAEMESAARRAETEMGGIDVVCINAGVISFAPAWQLTEEAWDQVVDTNLKGSWATCRAVIPGMIRRRKGGCLVFIISVAGLKGYPSMAHYVAAKHGLVGLTRALALELARHDIRVNAVAPGGVRTPMGVSAAMQSYLAEEPEAAASLRAALDVDLLEPAEISRAVVWLASDEASRITGVVLPVDAGTLLR